MILFRTVGLLLGALLAVGPGVAAQELVRVSRVVDADTYEVISQSRRERVRLLGVDAPEQSQPFGAVASDSVRALLGRAGGLVELTLYGHDLYGRTLGTVRVGLTPTGRLLALDSVLVVRGWAWTYAPGRQRVRWVAEQQRAQAGGLGLWQCGLDAAVPPWLWRGFNKEIKRHYRIDCPR
ncbi:thermonuclease family protein [Hymenobacter terrestris]|uniref:Thermonuclease family protein n=1 Tax=Hymenobacter terrestris TaxID=2748310 RepID=A0ABX2Q0L2_9BACT|nr:thermonuclease family protein [Hymenobacter terrestris]NVO84488.1 thermonuclease family protein [Hymenobacter terrestris]